MAGYKQPCMACGQFIDFDSNSCPICGRSNPFTDSCPTCSRDVRRDWRMCPSCSRLLYIACLRCGAQTFVGDACDACGASLMIRCPQKRCGAPQFFENTKCNRCGKKIDPKNKQFIV